MLNTYERYRHDNIGFTNDAGEAISHIRNTDDAKYKKVYQGVLGTKGVYLFDLERSGNLEDIEAWLNEIYLSNLINTQAERRKKLKNPSKIKKGMLEELSETAEDVQEALAVNATQKLIDMHFQSKKLKKEFKKKLESIGKDQQPQDLEALNETYTYICMTQGTFCAHVLCMESAIELYNEILSPFSLPESKNWFEKAHNLLIAIIGSQELDIKLRDIILDALLIIIYQKLSLFIDQNEDQINNLKEKFNKEFNAPLLKALYPISTNELSFARQSRLSILSQNSNKLNQQDKEASLFDYITALNNNIISLINKKAQGDTATKKKNSSSNWLKLRSSDKKSKGLSINGDGNDYEQAEFAKPLPPVFILEFTFAHSSFNENPLNLLNSVPQTVDVDNLESALNGVLESTATIIASGVTPIAEVQKKATQVIEQLVNTAKAELLRHREETEKNIVRLNESEHSSKEKQAKQSYQNDLNKIDWIHKDAYANLIMMGNLRKNEEFKSFNDHLHNPAYFRYLSDPEEAVEKAKLARKIRDAYQVVLQEIDSKYSWAKEAQANIDTTGANNSLGNKAFALFSGLSGTAQDNLIKYRRYIEQRYFEAEVNLALIARDLLQRIENADNNHTVEKEYLESTGQASKLTPKVTSQFEQVYAAPMPVSVLFESYIFLKQNTPRYLEDNRLFDFLDLNFEPISLNVKPEDKALITKLNQTLEKIASYLNNSVRLISILGVQLEDLGLLDWIVQGEEILESLRKNQTLVSGLTNEQLQKVEKRFNKEARKLLQNIAKSIKQKNWLEDHKESYKLFEEKIIKYDSKNTVVQEDQELKTLLEKIVNREINVLTGYEAILERLAIARNKAASEKNIELYSKAIQLLFLLVTNNIEDANNPSITDKERQALSTFFDFSQNKEQFKCKIEELLGDLQNHMPQDSSLLELVKEKITAIKLSDLNHMQLQFYNYFDLVDEQIWLEEVNGSSTKLIQHIEKIDKLDENQLTDNDIQKLTRFYFFEKGKTRRTSFIKKFTSVADKITLLDEKNLQKLNQLAQLALNIVPKDNDIIAEIKLKFLELYKNNPIELNSSTTEHIKAVLNCKSSFSQEEVEKINDLIKLEEVIIEHSLCEYCSWIIDSETDKSSKSSIAKNLKYNLLYNTIEFCGEYQNQSNYTECVNSLLERLDVFNYIKLDQRELEVLQGLLEDEERQKTLTNSPALANLILNHSPNELNNALWPLMLQRVFINNDQIAQNEGFTGLVKHLETITRQTPVTWLSEDTIRNLQDKVNQLATSFWPSEAEVANLARLKKISENLTVNTYLNPHTCAEFYHLLECFSIKERHVLESYLPDYSIISNRSNHSEIIDKIKWSISKKNSFEKLYKLTQQISIDKNTVFQQWETISTLMSVFAPSEQAILLPLKNPVKSVIKENSTIHNLRNLLSQNFDGSHSELLPIMKALAQPLMDLEDLSEDSFYRKVQQNLTVNLEIRLLNLAESLNEELLNRAEYIPTAHKTLIGTYIFKRIQSLLTNPESGDLTHVEKLTASALIETCCSIEQKKMLQHYCNLARHRSEKNTLLVIALITKTKEIKASMVNRLSSPTAAGEAFKNFFEYIKKQELNDSNAKDVNASVIKENSTIHNLRDLLSQNFDGSHSELFPTMRALAQPLMDFEGLSADSFYQNVQQNLTVNLEIQLLNLAESLNEELLNQAEHIPTEHKTLIGTYIFKRIQSLLTNPESGDLTHVEKLTASALIETCCSIEQKKRLQDYCNLARHRSEKSTLLVIALITKTKEIKASMVNRLSSPTAAGEAFKSVVEYIKKQELNDSKSEDINAIASLQGSDESIDPQAIIQTLFDSLREDLVAAGILNNVDVPGSAPRAYATKVSKLLESLKNGVSNLVNYAYLNQGEEEQRHALEKNILWMLRNIDYKAILEKASIEKATTFFSFAISIVKKIDESKFFRKSEGIEDKRLLEDYLGDLLQQFEANRNRANTKKSDFNLLEVVGANDSNTTISCLLTKARNHVLIEKYKAIFEPNWQVNAIFTPGKIVDERTRMISNLSPQTYLETVFSNDQAALNEQLTLDALLQWVHNILKSEQDSDSQYKAKLVTLFHENQLMFHGSCVYSNIELIKILSEDSEFLKSVILIFLNKPNELTKSELVKISLIRASAISRFEHIKKSVTLTKMEENINFEAPKGLTDKTIEQLDKLLETNSFHQIGWLLNHKFSEVSKIDLSHRISDFIYKIIQNGFVRKANRLLEIVLFTLKPSLRNNFLEEILTMLVSKIDIDESQQKLYTAHIAFLACQYDLPIDKNCIAVWQSLCGSSTEISEQFSAFSTIFDSTEKSFFCTLAKFHKLLMEHNHEKHVFNFQSDCSFVFESDTPDVLSEVMNRNTKDIQKEIQVITKAITLCKEKFEVLVNELDNELDNDNQNTKQEAIRRCITFLINSFTENEYQNYLPAKAHKTILNFIAELAKIISFDNFVKDTFVETFFNKLKDFLNGKTLFVEGFEQALNLSLLARGQAQPTSISKLNDTIEPNIENYITELTQNISGLFNTNEQPKNILINREIKKLKPLIELLSEEKKVVYTQVIQLIEYSFNNNPQISDISNPLETVITYLANTEEPDPNIAYLFNLELFLNQDNLSEKQKFDLINLFFKFSFSSNGASIQDKWFNLDLLELCSKSSFASNKKPIDSPWFNKTLATLIDFTSTLVDTNNSETATLLPKELLKVIKAKKDLHSMQNKSCFSTAVNGLEFHLASFDKYQFQSDNISLSQKHSMLFCYLNRLYQYENECGFERTNHSFVLGELDFAFSLIDASYLTEVQNIKPELYFLLRYFDFPADRTLASKDFEALFSTTATVEQTQLLSVIQESESWKNIVKSIEQSILDLTAEYERMCFDANFDHDEVALNFILQNASYKGLLQLSNFSDSEINGIEDKNLKLLLKAAQSAHKSQMELEALNARSKSMFEFTDIKIRENSNSEGPSTPSRNSSTSSIRSMSTSSSSATQSIDPPIKERYFSGSNSDMSSTASVETEDIITVTGNGNCFYNSMAVWLAHSVADYNTLPKESKNHIDNILYVLFPYLAQNCFDTTQDLKEELSRLTAQEASIQGIERLLGDPLKALTIEKLKDTSQTSEFIEIIEGSLQSIVFELATKINANQTLDHVDNVLKEMVPESDILYPIREQLRTTLATIEADMKSDLNSGYSLFVDEKNENLRDTFKGELTGWFTDNKAQLLKAIIEDKYANQLHIQALSQSLNLQIRVYSFDRTEEYYKYTNAYGSENQQSVLSANLAYNNRDHYNLWWPDAEIVKCVIAELEKYSNPGFLKSMARNHIEEAKDLIENIRKKWPMHQELYEMLKQEQEKNNGNKGGYYNSLSAAIKLVEPKRPEYQYQVGNTSLSELNFDGELNLEFL